MAEYMYEWFLALFVAAWYSMFWWLWMAGVLDIIRNSLWDQDESRTEQMEM